ncbi:MAG: LytTR family DNA-binding domain-containing protein [Tannerella sp.]|jgi:two-component system LytT family response regulator|nr:LytTR family DNA-binding domain-containing protein [Tannerella sp.]
MKTVIVEDEYVAAQSLQRLLESFDENIQILTVLQSVEESVEWFTLNPAPDLVFMDIHLADGYSFSIFEKVTVKCPVISTTAYDEYALKAFEFNSIDYLLKPINRKNLERALSKYRNFSFRPDDSDRIIRVAESLKQLKNAYKSHFLIPCKDKLLPLATDRIAYVCSEYKMAKIVTFDQQSYVLDMSLDELSKQLDPRFFFRANRQFLLSHKAIDYISLWFGSKLSVNLTVPAHEKIIVSRARAANFKNWYTQNSAV